MIAHQQYSAQFNMRVDKRVQSCHWQWKLALSLDALVARKLSESVA
ncbi:hypothetical protein [Nitrosomonas communis]|nr:hypothetical protein [Nitrosomonas communis]MCO6428846.1 hypothetical protein [Nitrosomonas communis]